MTEAEIRQSVVSWSQDCIGVKKGSQEHHTIIDIYNSYPNLPFRNGKPYKMTYADNWCAGFVSAVSIMQQLTDIMPVECSCTEMIRLYKELGRWVEDDAYVPQKGDIVMYYWNDGADYATTDQKNPPNHTGIVTSVDGDIVTVIEGNKGSESVVGYRSFKVNGRYIRGYCCPDYASKVDKPKEPWYMKTKSWDKATAMGLIDGTRPEDSITRAEVAEVAVRLVERFEGGTEDG